MNDSAKFIPFNRVYTTGNEIRYIKDAIERRELANNGHYTQLSQKWLVENLKTRAAFLTGAGTQALEMAAILLDLEPGDEIIMPSFTFATTASAFVRAGLVPVFVDIEPNTLNMAPGLVRKAITPKTRAIVPVHYAGVACDMTEILQLARDHNLKVVEDAAHGILAKFKEQYLGTMGSLGVLSFQETKNIVCGEGGALLVNDESLIERTRQIWQKGTNKLDMDDGMVAKYTWTELGSSFAASEVSASFLYAQLERAQEILEVRKRVWSTYHQLLESLEKRGLVQRPTIPGNRMHNSHIYYLLTSDAETRNQLLKHLRSDNIECVFHYIPLHNSPAGLKYCRAADILPVTDSISERLIRLPMFPTLSTEEQRRVVDSIESFYEGR